MGLFGGIINKNNKSSQNGNRSMTFTFDSLPTDIEMLKAMPEAALRNPFETAAVTVAVLCCYEHSPEKCFEMLDMLRGPRPLSNFDKQFIKERLCGREYIPRSYFNGTSPANNYTPGTPYTVTISENPYSYTNEGYATLWLTSSGADSPRQLVMRSKPSTGQWFLWEIMLLSQIREAAANDPWL